MNRTLLSVFICMLPLGCSAPNGGAPGQDGPPSPAGDGPPSPLVNDPPTRAAPDGWKQAPPATFETIVEEVRSWSGPWTWSEQAQVSFGAALDSPGSQAVHAAVLLAHDRSPRSFEVLLARLEGRHVAETRELDAGDVVGAAALENLTPGPGQLQRLVALAEGPAPHPDLEVRVEIARSALALGADEVIPFLIRVLRALTPAEREDPGDWPRITTLFWAKSRAAEALTARAGERRVRFRPDSSWEDQAAEAGRLEALLMPGASRQDQ